MDSDKYLENLLIKYQHINDKYNEEYNFNKVNRVKKKSTSSDYLAMGQSKLLNNKLDKLNKIRKRKKIKKDTEECANILSDDIMSYNDGSDNKNWKQLQITEKIDKIEQYFLLSSKYNEEETLLNKIKELIQSNKIDYKKYIIYDKINERIDDLPIIRYNDDTKIYELLTDIEKKDGKKKGHKKKISKIFKIK
jgi:hypothetical protein